MSFFLGHVYPAGVMLVIVGLAYLEPRPGSVLERRAVWIALAWPIVLAVLFAVVAVVSARRARLTGLLLREYLRYLGLLLLQYLAAVLLAIAGRWPSTRSFLLPIIERLVRDE